MSDEPDTDGQRNARDGSSESDLTLGRREVMSAVGSVGLGGALSGSASAERAGGAGVGNRPWYAWDADVDAGGNLLRELGGVDVDHVHTSARAAEVVVWRDADGVYHADGDEDAVASGEELMRVVQAAVDGLSDGREVRERVLVASSGVVREGDEVTGVDLPSHTVVDVAGEIVVEGETGDLFSATGAENVAIPRLTVKGAASRAVFLDDCRKVRLGRLHVEGVSVQGVRIQGGSEDVQIGSVYLEDTGHHGVETYDVTRVQIGQVIGVDPGSSVVLLNETSDATVGQVVGKNPKFDYATFRLANGCRNVTCGRVVSRGGVRGVSIITGTRDVTVGEVNVRGGRKAGMLLVDVRNVNVLGGVIKDVDGPGVNIWSLGLQGTASEVNEGITLSNLRITDERPEGERAQTWAIREDGACLNNRFVDNDVRGGGTEGLIDVGSETTVVDRNSGGGLASGTVTLSPGSSPAARVEGVTADQSSSLVLRAQPLDAPDAAFAWTDHFEWTGDRWDLVFEWRTDPGRPLTLEYVVDRPQATTDREFDREEVWGESVPTVEPGTYRVVNANSGKVMEVAGGSTSVGAPVQQGTWNDEPHQRWTVTGGGSDWRVAARLEPEHSGLALDESGERAVQGPGREFTLERYESGHQIKTGDGRFQVADAAAADGADVVEGEWEGGAHQIWLFERL